MAFTSSARAVHTQGEPGPMDDDYSAFDGDQGGAFEPGAVPGVLCGVFCVAEALLTGVGCSFPFREELR